MDLLRGLLTLPLCILAKVNKKIERVNNNNNNKDTERMDLETGQKERIHNCCFSEKEHISLITVIKTDLVRVCAIYVYCVLHYRNVISNMVRFKAKIRQVIKLIMLQLK